MPFLPSPQSQRKIPGGRLRAILARRKAGLDGDV
jgi:hypothetical protein